MTVTDAPRLSIAERDRRWDRIRGFMRERGLGGLVVAGLRAREAYEAYVSNEAIQGVVIFPAEGEPVYLTWIAFRIVGRDDPQNDREYWIRDIRPGLLGPGIASTLAEMGLAEEKVGVVGIHSRGPMELEGYIPYAMWNHVVEHLPKAQFDDVSLDFGLLMLQKSEEELTIARYCANVGEMACQTMLEVTEPGVLESDIYASVMDVITRQGLTVTPPSLIVKSGREALSWGPPEWGIGDVPPRTIGHGELVSAELMATYAGIETQQQMMIAVGPVEPLWRELADVARRSYDAGLEALRPGVTFFELCAAMWAPLQEADCWHLSPLVHSVSPACLLGTLHGGAEKVFADQYPWFKTQPALYDAELKEGMLFAFEPNACRGRHRVNIGGAIVVGASGPEELNKFPCQMHEVS